MLKSRPPHDPESCTLCERVSPEGYRRHWKHERKAGAWHAIADGPDVMARLPRQAHFLTILAYRSAPDGPLPHYQGSLYWEFDAADPTSALTDLRRCIQILGVEFGCPLEVLRLWLSGGRGFHATIPPMVIGAESGHPLLPQIYLTMIEQLFPCGVAPTLDRGIYSGGKGRMWRLPNRRRTDTHRYKIPLTTGEALHQPYAAIEALTLRPRKGIFWPSDEELSACPALVELYQETAAAIERRAMGNRSKSRPASGRDGLLLHAFGNRGWLGQELEPGKWAVVCPWASHHTKGESLDTSTVLFAPGEGEATGWFHCSHGHCANRTLQEVLGVFTPEELAHAREVAGRASGELKSSSAALGYALPPPLHGMYRHGGMSISPRRTAGGVRFVW